MSYMHCHGSLFDSNHLLSLHFKNGAFICCLLAECRYFSFLMYLILILLPRSVSGVSSKVSNHLAWLSYSEERLLLYCIVFEYLYSALQQPWANRGAFGLISSKKREVLRSDKDLERLDDKREARAEGGRR